MLSRIEASKAPVAFLIHGIGDTILALPALRALSDMFSGRLSLIHAKADYDFLFDDIPLQRRIAVTASGAEDGARFRLDEGLFRDVPCDLFLSLVPWLNQDLTDAIGNFNPACSIGFRDLFSIPLTIDYSKHSAELTFDVVRALDPARCLSDYAAPPAVPLAALDFASALLAELPKNTVRIAVHMDTMKEKMWRSERWIEVFDELLARNEELYVIVLGLTKCTFAGTKFADRIIPCQKLPFAMSLALIQSADIFVGVDSCLLHAADFSRIPSIGLFGPTQPHEFGFLLTQNVTVKSPSGAMDDIAAFEVIAAIETVLTGC